MSHDECERNILDLPSGLLMKVFGSLSYGEVESLRPTCSWFNSVANYVLGVELHRIKKRADAAAKRFLRSPWLKTSHHNTTAAQTYDKRLAKGAASLVILNGLLRTADALSLHLIRAGALPPLPRVVLEAMSKAVTISSWRNPLVGVDRLHTIYRHLVAYFKRHRDIGVRVLSPVPMYRTVLEVLDNMPKLMSSLRMTKLGEEVCLTFTLPPVRVDLAPIETVEESTSRNAGELLFKLLQLGLHAVSGYIQSKQAQQVMDVGPVREHDGYMLSVEVTVPCGSLEELSIHELQKLEPPGFSVALSGFRLTSTSDLEGTDAKEDVTLNFKF